MEPLLVLIPPLLYHLMWIARTRMSSRHEAIVKRTRERMLNQAVKTLIRTEGVIAGTGAGGGVLLVIS